MTDSTATAPPAATDTGGLRRRVGAFQATAINMGQMCGAGPFITIPAMIAAFNGPQAVIGWVAGAVLALADGLVWAELGAALPGSGGTYIYLREAFQYRTGRLMPFLFVWTAILFIPLTMSTGVLGFVQYLGYLWPHMGQLTGDAVGVLLVAFIVLLLWRRIESIGKLTVVLWAVMLASVLLVIVASYQHFDASMAFTYPKHAFDVGHGGFWIGFAAGLTVGIYDYLGYNTTSYLGAEARRPGRTIPRSIVFSVLGIMVIYLLMQIGVLGVIPWKEMLVKGSAANLSVASAAVAKVWGTGAADVVTVLILVTAFTSVLAGLLGGSRVPFDAARDGVFFRPFGRLHPRHRFPVLPLLIMGAITAVGFLIGRHTDLTTLIGLLTTVMVLVQGLSQIAALVVLRRRRPDLRRPYRMWLYPLPALVALVGWVVIYGFADRSSPGKHPIEWSLAWVVIGVLAFLGWAAYRRIWPFGPRQVHEAYRDDDALEPPH